MHMRCLDRQMVMSGRQTRGAGGGLKLVDLRRKTDGLFVSAKSRHCILRPSALAMRRRQRMEALGFLLTVGTR